MTDTVNIKFTGPTGTERVLPVPLTHWVGFKNGLAITHYSCQAQVDIGLRYHKIDSAIPAEHIAQNIAANAKAERVQAKAARVYTPPGGLTQRQQANIEFEKDFGWPACDEGDDDYDGAPLSGGVSDPYDQDAYEDLRNGQDLLDTTEDYRDGRY